MTASLIERLAAVPEVWTEQRPWAFAPDGHTLAFTWRRDGDWHVYLKDLRDAAAPRRVEAFDDPCVCPVFSPDGAYLYFARDDHGSECFDIYRCDLADGTLVNLLPDTPTLSPAPDFALSPDGRSLAFAVNHGASCSTAVMAAEPGAAMAFLTDHWFNDWSPRYSPDGALLAFASETHGQDTAVFIVPAGGGELRAIGGEDMMIAHDPAWSPDGRSLAFAGGGGVYEAIGLYDLERSSSAGSGRASATPTPQPGRPTAAPSCSWSTTAPRARCGTSTSPPATPAAST